MTKTVFISGHLDLTAEEFKEHYAPLIDAALERGDSFVIGDAFSGADRLAQMHLSAKPVPLKVAIYHMLEKPRYLVDGSFEVVGGFASDNSRDKAMTLASDYDIAWVRPGREASGTARNIERRKRLLR